jgi:hypothetical protein
VDEMGRTCSTNGEIRTTYKILIGNAQVRVTLGRYNEKDNIKMDLGGTE